MRDTHTHTHTRTHTHPKRRYNEDVKKSELSYTDDVGYKLIQPLDSLKYRINLEIYKP